MWIMKDVLMPNNIVQIDHRAIKIINSTISDITGILMDSREITTIPRSQAKSAKFITFCPKELPSRNLITRKRSTGTRQDLSHNDAGTAGIGNQRLKKKGKNKVYLLNMGGGFFKIGITNNISRRIKELTTGCPFKIKILNIWNYTALSDALYAEDKVLKYMRKHQLNCEGGTEIFKGYTERSVFNTVKRILS